MVVAMRTGGSQLRLCVVAVAMTAGFLLAGCSSDSQTAESSPYLSAEGPAATPMPAAPQEPLTESPADDATAEKNDIVITGSISMTVDNPTEAADWFAEATAAADGRVESRTEQAGLDSPSATLTLRIPSDQLDAVLADIDDLGVVDSRNINYDDVTAQRVDLDARIEALQTSVDRLLELMSRADSVEDLLAAESSLTQRQAELDSLQAQRTALGDQIAYATITVSLSSTPPVIAEGGFIGAIKTGWQSLVNFGGGLANLIGFLLPWIPVFAVIGGAFYFFIRTLNRRSKAALSAQAGLSAQAVPVAEPVLTPPAAEPPPPAEPKP